VAAEKVRVMRVARENEQLLPAGEFRQRPSALDLPFGIEFDEGIIEHEHAIRALQEMGRHSKPQGKGQDIFGPCRQELVGKHRAILADNPTRHALVHFDLGIPVTGHGGHIARQIRPEPLEGVGVLFRQ
jgi:hypothetical protein